MKFSRCFFRPGEIKIKKASINRKKKRIQKENEKYSLFQEFQKADDDNSCISEIEKEKQGWENWKKSWRSDVCEDWKLIREHFKAHYDIWARHTMCPLTPEYFFCFIQSKKGAFV